jgi:hypothetical protein
LIEEGRFLPYKDPEKRRIFQRDYQRRRRAKAGLTNPCQTLTTKAYVCLKVPQLRLPGIAFKFGFFVTDQPDEQAMIEQDPLYGKDIFSWKLDT